MRNHKEEASAHDSGLTSYLKIKNVPQNKFGERIQELSEKEKTMQTKNNGKNKRKRDDKNCFSQLNFLKESIQNKNRMVKVSNDGELHGISNDFSPHQSIMHKKSALNLKTVDPHQGAFEKINFLVSSSKNPNDHAPKYPDLNDYELVENEERGGAWVPKS
jgi:hypothetical protein